MLPINSVITVCRLQDMNNKQDFPINSKQLRKQMLILRSCFFDSKNLNTEVMNPAEQEKSDSVIF